VSETPRWLDADELAAWMPLGGMLMALPNALESQLKRDADLSLFGYFVLVGLSESPDRTLPMSTLAGFASGSLSRLSHAVAKLEREGWVERRPSPEDGRITIATLTDAGFAKLEKTAPGHVETVRRLVVDRLTPDQLQAVGAAARIITDGLLGPCDPTAETSR